MKWLVIIAATAALAATARTRQPTGNGPEARAVAFLAVEVPRWKAANDCYSCHNNGDAARALIVSGARGFAVGSAMDDTLEWLRRPSAWNKNKTTGGIDDKPLARIQFAGALRLAAANRQA